jgi:peroxiredoxin Q/BCP
MENQLAPDFELPGTGDIRFHPGDYLGRCVVLYFYPKDNTPGCTTEGLDFAASHGDFRAAGCELFGISRDSLKSHEGFKAKLNLPFELLADPDEVACELFGVMKMKNMYGKTVRGIERSTFVIDRKGRVAKAWRGVKVPDHVQEVLAYVKSL